MQTGQITLLRRIYKQDNMEGLHRTYSKTYDKKNAEIALNGY